MTPSAQVAAVGLFWSLPLSDTLVAVGVPLAALIFSGATLVFSLVTLRQRSGADVLSAQASENAQLTRERDSARTERDDYRRRCRELEEEKQWLLEKVMGLERGHGE